MTPEGFSLKMLRTILQDQICRHLHEISYDLEPEISFDDVCAMGVQAGIDDGFEIWQRVVVPTVNDIAPDIKKAMKAKDEKN